PDSFVEEWSAFFRHENRSEKSLGGRYASNVAQLLSIGFFVGGCMLRPHDSYQDCKEDNRTSQNSTANDRHKGSRTISSESESKHHASKRWGPRPPAPAGSATCASVSAVTSSKRKPILCAGLSPPFAVS